MKIYCEKEKLNEKISIVQKAISNRTTQVSLQGILIKAENGKITLIGSDLDLTIETELYCEIEEEGSILVESRLFGDIVRKLPNEKIKIEDKDNIINISCRKSTFNLVSLNKNDYPALPQIASNDDIKISEKVLKNLIRSTIFSVAQEETRPVLTGVLFEFTGENLNLVALDGYRLAFRCESIQSSSKVKEVIPGKTLSELYKILTDSENIVIMSFERNRVLFKTNGTKISSRLLEGEFIEYSNIIPTDFATIYCINKNEIQGCIERASLVTRDGDSNTSLVVLNIKSDALEISSRSKLGNFNEELSTRSVKVKELKIAFNSKYLLDIFKVLDCEDIVMNFNTSVTPCIIKSIENESSAYLVLPVKIPA